jgi:hypothetical protein
LAIVGALVGAMGLLGSPAEAARSDTGAAAFAAHAKAKGPKSGPKRQGPFTRVSGRVTNSLTGEGVGGVSVTFAATAVSYSTVTDANGDYAEKLPIAAGGYVATYEAGNFQTQVLSSLSLPKGRNTLDVALVPVAPVIVTAEVGGDAVPGAVLTAVGSYTIMDGSTFVSSEWTQTESVAVDIAAPAAQTTAVTLPGAGAFKDELIHLLSEPPVGADELPPNVEVPPGEFVGGLQDRVQVVAINHFALERAGHVALQFAVVTTSGTYPAHVDLHAALPWKVNPGLRNVPIDAPALLYGKEQAMWAWTLTGAPAGSTASLTDADTQSPEFTPDLAGLYTLTESESGESLAVHAGTWRGVIVGQDMDGRPVADDDCTICHKPPPVGLGIAADKFTPWAQTGHAEIFTNNLNTSTHYGEGCFGCHTVGFDLQADNEGIDEAFDYEAFLVSDLLNNPGDNWTAMLDLFPDSAQMANIQCENCHGPQSGSGAHTNGDPRTSLSSEVCASCHGEPLRHARFQQWQLSRHANYELAIDESDSGNCSRCHTGNGFLTWLPVLAGDVPGDPLDNITVSWTPDETHPQTCVVCHDPHMIGTTSGNNTNATVRISDDTPLLVAGFQAFGVGKGAMCMTCHNTRRGLRNDSIDFGALSDRDRAPHGGVQADLLMGQNAYFVTVGTRGAHSFVSDTCVNCHMTATPPPDVLAYNQGGSNHTFFASEEVCLECHTGGEPNTAGVQAAINGPLHQLEGLITDHHAALMGDLLAAGNHIDLNGDATITDPSEILAVHLSETRGRQALVVELASGTFGPARLTDIDVIVGPDAGDTLFDHVSETVLKATWNYLLVHTDRSGGVHNPSYSSAVLTAAIAQMQ